MKNERNRHYNIKTSSPSPASLPTKKNKLSGIEISTRRTRSQPSTSESPGLNESIKKSLSRTIGSQLGRHFSPAIERGRNLRVCLYIPIHVASRKKEKKCVRVYASTAWNRVNVRRKDRKPSQIYIYKRLRLCFYVCVNSCVREWHCSVQDELRWEGIGIGRPVLV